MYKLKDRMEVNNIYGHVSKKKNQSRKEKNDSQKSFSKVSISWYKPTYGKLPMKSYK